MHITLLLITLISTHMLRLLSSFALISIIFVSCTPNHVNEDASLQKYFDQYKLNGTFGLFDNGTGEFYIYNLTKFSDSAVSPASTFKIINSLIGIETGVVANDSTIFEWDGKPSGRPACDSALTMKNAFQISCLSWYQQLARKIGKEKMQYYLDTLGYGAHPNKFKITGAVDSFWIDESVKVTADEQLGIVKKLYFDQLPFQKRTQKIVKNMMLREDNANYKLSYKTGLSETANGHQTGWIIGWIEENEHPYFFSLEVETNDTVPSIAEARLQLLKDILKHYGYMSGKK